jgi:hypothetical protein
MKIGVIREISGLFPVFVLFPIKFIVRQQVTQSSCPNVFSGHPFGAKTVDSRQKMQE